jgi:hypothetical protein
MPERQESAVVSCPPNTPPTNPIKVPLGFGGGILRVIRIVIPTGHAGLTGIALGYGGNPTIPFGRFAYYSGDDREIDIRYSDRQPGVQWAAFLCSNDQVITHAWEVDMDFDDTDGNVAPLITPILSSDIVTAGADAMAGL